MFGGGFMQCEFPQNMMRNILVTIKYSGVNYHGWQIQKNALSVQEVFQQALYKILEHEVDIKGCSRTDAGVHANMYCINFKTTRDIPCERFIFAINRFLPNDIAVVDCKEVDEDFHARYSCKGKEYVYKIWNHKIRDPFLVGHALHYWYPINEKELDEESKAFIGKHNFKSFCTIDSRDSENFVRTVRDFNVTRNGDMIEFKVSANGFLYNMVRIMVGTLLAIQHGKIKKNQISKIILEKDRAKAGPTARACGLYLNKVFY